MYTIRELECCIVPNVLVHGAESCQLCLWLHQNNALIVTIY